MMFAQKLKERNLQLKSQLCLGIDPHLEKLSPFMQKEHHALGDRHFLERLSCTLIDIFQDKMSSVKFQSSFFEAVGEEGFGALRSSIAYARKCGMISVLDAKRGDISSTMKAYGQAAFEYFNADSMTVTPYMGYDVVQPLEPWLKRGRGIFLVWITSNPEARNLQELKIAEGRIFGEALLEYFDKRLTTQDLKDAVGLVLGSTKVEILEDRLLDRASTYPLLMPGIGIQGGSVTPRIKNLLDRSPASLVPMSRSLTGIGDPTFEDEFKNLKSWKNYQDLVVQKAVANGLLP